VIHYLSKKQRLDNPKEDTQTSSIIGDLLHLPSDLFWVLLRNSCTDKVFLPVVCGEILDFEFWPHWDATGTVNTTIVEPDVFISFEEFDLIIEAKKYDESGQYENQWRNEIGSYYNNFPSQDKKLIVVAIGGSKDMQKKDLTINRLLSDNKSKICSVPIFKCNWLSILIEVTRVLDEIQTIKYKDSIRSSHKRILQDVIRSFNIHSLYFLKWLDSLNRDNLNIGDSSIDVFKLQYRLNHTKNESNQ